MLALRHRAHRNLRQLATTLMAVGGLLLLARWFGPALSGATIAMLRPVGFSLVGVGALLMWWAGRSGLVTTGRARVADTETIRLLPLPPTEWHASVFRAIEWRRFEALCDAPKAAANSSRCSRPGEWAGLDE